MEWLKELIPAINELGLSDREHAFWFSFRRFKMKLPADSQFHLREKKHGLIIVSMSAGIVLKIFLAREYARLLDEEIGTLKRLSSTRFTSFIPQVLDDGRIGDHGRWMKMDYHPGEKIKDLQKEMQTILNPISILHHDTGEVLSLADWLQKAFERALNFPSREEMMKLLKVIEQEGSKFPGYAVVESLIHHDIHAENVRLSENNHPIFIDWEGEIKGLTLIDFLDFGRRQMKNDLDLRSSPFDLYREILKRDFGIELSPGSIKLSYLIYAAERSLLLFEKRQVNRLSDEKGFEARLLKSIQ